jgi:hypothetical protein
MIKCYNIRFTGRLKGAIGKFYPIEAQRFANNPEEAKLLLYDTYDHIQLPEIKEVPSPFDSESIELFVRNDRDYLESVAHHANMLVALIDRAAIHIAKANAQWHDDPESPDHWLFHADHEMQFPPEVRIKAAAELILYRLRETPAGMEIFNQLLLPEEKK